MFTPTTIQVQVTRKLGSTVIVYPPPATPPLPVILGEVIDLRISLNGATAVAYTGDYAIPDNAEQITIFLHDENGNIIDVKSIPVIADSEEIVEALLETGVNIGDKTVTITSDNFKVQNNPGEETFLTTENGV